MADADPAVIARTSELVQSRIDELGMSPTSFARHAKVDPQTVLRLLEKRGTSFRTDSMKKMSEGLDWPPGALLRLMRGEDPDAVIPRSQTVTPRGIQSGESWGTPTVSQSPPAPDVDGGLLVFASGADVAGLDQDDVEEVQAVVDTMLDRLKARKQRGR